MLPNGPSTVGHLIDAHLAALLSLTLPRSSSGAFDALLDRDGAPAGAVPTPDPDAPDDFEFVFLLPGPVPWSGLEEYAERVLEVYDDVLELRSAAGDPLAVRARAPSDQPASRVPWETVDLGPRQEDEARRQPLHSVARATPTIVALARHWALLAGLLRPGLPDPQARIDAMALRRASDWLVPSTGHPAEVYQHLSRVCNVACRFCYLFGNPDDLGVGRGRRVVSPEELRTRLKYFDPARGTALFRAEWEINEELIDPKVFTLLPELRTRTALPFEFMTNGSPLNDKVLRLLDEVAPVHLVVSINSLDESVRHEVMRENSRNSRTALSSLTALTEHEIPFGVSFVATPSVPLDALAASVRGVDRIGPAFIRVNLPGYTRDSPDRPEGDLETLWHAAVGMLSALRRELATPVIVIPSAFEFNLVRHEPLAPRVTGAVPGSPAARAGVRPDDVVLQVGHHTIRDRAHLLSVLLLTRGQVPVVVERGGATSELVVDFDAPPAYPWPGPAVGKYVFPAGFAVAPCLSVHDVRTVLRAAEDGDGEVWVATSSLMRPAAQAALDATGSAYAASARLVPVRNRFLGGNIQVMDMATVGDIARSVDEALAEHPAPSRLLLPASGLNEHGRDLAGTHWHQLERWTGVPVQLLTGTTQFVY